MLSPFTVFLFGSRFSIFLKQIYIAYHMDEFDESSCKEDDDEDKTAEENEEEQEIDDEKSDLVLISS